MSDIILYFCRKSKISRPNLRAKRVFAKNSGRRPSASPRAVSSGRSTPFRSSKPFCSARSRAHTAGSSKLRRSRRRRRRGGRSPCRHRRRASKAVRRPRMFRSRTRAKERTTRRRTHSQKCRCFQPSRTPSRSRHTTSRSRCKSSRSRCKSSRSRHTTNRSRKSARRTRGGPLHRTRWNRANTWFFPRT